MFTTMGGVVRCPRAPRLLLLLYAVMGVACAGPSDAIDADCTVTGRYMPMRTGASWTYRSTGASGARDKLQEVGALEDVGGSKAGVMAFRVTTTKPSGSVVSWQQDTGEAIIRHREQDLSGTTQTDELYTPYHTRIDEGTAHLAVGATWDETYDENVTDVATGMVTVTTKTDTWVVEADDEPVRVAAGDFCALRLRRSTVINGAAKATKTYWFSRGVGKIKEVTGGGDTEELSSFIP